jgi:hypothetical protein
MDLRTVDEALEGIVAAVALIEETQKVGDHSPAAKVCISRAASAARDLHGDVEAARDQLANSLAGDDFDAVAAAAKTVSQSTRGAVALLEYAETQCSFPEQRSGTTTVTVYGEEGVTNPGKEVAPKLACAGALGSRGEALTQGATKVVVHEAPWTFEERLAVSLLLRDEVVKGNISCNAKAWSRLRDKFDAVVEALHQAHSDQNLGGEERALAKAQKGHDLFHKLKARCD